MIIERASIPTKSEVAERITGRLVNLLSPIAGFERFSDKGLTIMANIRSRIEEAYEQGYNAAYDRFYNDPNVIDCHNIGIGRYNEIIDSCPEIKELLNRLPEWDPDNDKFEQVYVMWAEEKKYINDETPEFNETLGDTRLRDFAEFIMDNGSTDPKGWWELIDSQLKTRKNVSTLVDLAGNMSNYEWYDFFSKMLLCAMTNK